MEVVHRRLAPKYLGDIASVRNLRFCGTIAAFEVENDEENHYYNNISPILRERFLAKGLLLRPLGNTVYLMPPYCIDEPTLVHVYENIAAVLRDL
jgi:adenosylmethionine---8-amino-7-oxononanoate aminotransferase